MTSKISDSQKSQVIKLWVAGEPRDTIANITKVSGGTVTNIVDEWKRKVGNHDAEAVRELAIELKKKGIKLADLIPCIRLYNIAQTNAINEDDVESFIMEIQSHALSKGIGPEAMVNYSEQVLRISEQQAVLPSDVPNYLKEKYAEKQKIEDEIRALEQRKDELAAQVENEVQNNKITLEAISEHKKLDGALKKRGLSTADVKKLMNTLDNVQELGHDPSAVAATFSKITSLQKDIGHLQFVQESLAKKDKEYREKFQLYKEFESLKVQPQDLHGLIKKIEDIAAARSFPYSSAAAHFFLDINTNYDAIVGLEMQSLDLGKEIDTEKAQLKAFEKQYAKRRRAVDALEYLTTAGLSEPFMIHLKDLLQANESKVNIDTLEEDLKKYALLKDAIDKMTSENRRIEEEAARILAEKNSLTAEIDELRREIDVIVKVTKKNISDIANEATAKVRSVKDANTAPADSEEPT